MQANQPPILYTLCILTGKIYFCMQSISYLNICIFILWRIWQVGGWFFYAYDLILQTYAYITAFDFTNVDFEL